MGCEWTEEAVDEEELPPAEHKEDDKDDNKEPVHYQASPVCVLPRITCSLDAQIHRPARHHPDKRRRQDRRIGDIPRMLAHDLLDGGASWLRPLRDSRSRSCCVLDDRRCGREDGPPGGSPGPMRFSVDLVLRHPVPPKPIEMKVHRRRSFCPCGSRGSDRGPRSGHTS